MKKHIGYSLLFLVFLAWHSCSKANGDASPPAGQETVAQTHDLKAIQTEDTLHVGTLPGITSFFRFQKNGMGYDYELAENFARYLDVKLQLHIARTETEVIQWLKKGTVDLIACNLHETKELKDTFLFVPPQTESYQVLVQRQGRNQIQTAYELAGKTVHVRKNSIYHKRLAHLNEEIGGNINITFVPDSIATDELIKQILNQQIDYTPLFHDEAAIYRNYFKKLNHHTPIGFPQQGGWLMRKDTPELLAALSEWNEKVTTIRLKARLESKYKLHNPYLAGHKVRIPTGAISPYDDLFRKYAPEIDWDWRLLASMAFHESTFDSATVSPAGAVGLMQLMPRTAEIYGMDSTSFFLPEENIKAAVGYLKDIDKLFRKISNEDERVKFVLAGYNGGPYHIIDAMALAERYGKNPHIWHGNVEYFLEQKGTPDFYMDSVVKYGPFHANETVRYVDNVLSTYGDYLSSSTQN